MKKYASYKTLNQHMDLSMPYTKYEKVISINKQKKPLHLHQIDRNLKVQKFDIYPSTAKYSAHTAYNLKKKQQSIISNKNNNNNNNNFNRNNVQNDKYIKKNSNDIQHGYSHIKNKIITLQGKLKDIKLNYEKVIQKKKIGSNNKENQTPKNPIEKSKKNKNHQFVYHQQQKKTQQNQQQKKQQKQCKQQQQKQYKIKKNNDQKRIYLNKENNIISKDHNNNNNNNNNKLMKLDSNSQISSELKKYITSYDYYEPKNQIIECSSQTNLLSLKNDYKTNNSSYSKQYYIGVIIEAFNKNKPNSFDQLCRNHLITSIQILSFMKNKHQNIPYPLKYYYSGTNCINRQTIIFDLDQTLIHCNQNVQKLHDVCLPIRFPNNSIIHAGINIRPYARQILAELSSVYQLIIFTASHQCYANVIIDHLDPEGKFISNRYFRQSCHKTQQGLYIKDLRIIDRPLNQVLLVDNAAYSYCFQIDNGVPIIPFYDNKADLQLKSLMKYLKEFKGVTDMRIKNNQKMKLSEYYRYKDSKVLINNLYK